jgi:acetate---CoA ligase (ADP-forming)
MQGKGLGTILLGQLAEAADQAGVEVLGAEVLPQNHKMIQVFRDSGFPVRTHAVPGELLFEVPTSLTPEGLERFERREQTAAVAAMRAFLAPRSVAVVGASRRRGTVGAELFHNPPVAGSRHRSSRMMAIISGTVVTLIRGRPWARPAATSCRSRTCQSG